MAISISNASSKKKNPSVDPLYFSTDKNESSSFASLPVELLSQCLVEFSSWGDLAKLSCVQKTWSNLLMDASVGSEWALAEALLEGTDGLQKNSTLAMKFLHQLAGVIISSDEDNNSNDIAKYEIISDKPFAPAMKRLGECYFKQNNKNEGLAWLHAAYDLGGDLQAAYDLGTIYENGKFDVEMDVYLATEWFRKSAEGGHLDGMAEYAMCCELGCGREINDEESLEWYMRAARKGHVTANFSVGEAFEEARGVPQSDSEACIWYSKAAVKGDDGSIAALRRLRDIARIVCPGITNLLGN
mmetsp:Transcript_5440/g.7876  ORF Transcript_5440/g.7876 Transcript_5440/m.7876 type:complete len:300 (-) Transcript_5440:91-990(-)|eukprot:CAMPEP_0194222654 /NCGR_PEP_ID=MMETSP0156-20130528/33446_1 /TAXON_ID=33649 /ORGANISM="Thalassionema nitzschioides, Strain L26-B" /LENGTH=299 /DNA_ID=CAMNT_0038953537 /DNA_START=179 /DNA_END=1078 /DNA_ORIENTATION=-